MQMILQKICGRPEQLPVTLRRCGPADAPAFFALQNEVRAAMPHPEQFVPDTLENLTAYLTDDLCLGVFEGRNTSSKACGLYCLQIMHLSYSFFFTFLFFYLKRLHLTV